MLRLIERALPLAFLLTLVVGLLLGCTNHAEEAATRATSREATEARIADAKILAPGKLSVEWTRKVGPHEIVAVTIPSVDDQIGFTTLHQCFVWRDGENGSSSMTCTGSTLDISNMRK